MTRADPWADVPPNLTEPGSVNGSAPRPFELLTRSDLGRLPTPKPLIADTLDQGTVFILAGSPGTLKSFVALDWCGCVATGLPWQNRAISEQRRVLYVAAEGAYGLDRRLTAWERHRNTAIPDLDLMTHRYPVHLGDARAIESLCSIIRGEGFGFVVMDTLAKCIPGMDENSASDAGRALDSLYRMRDATGPTGVIGAVHHMGKNKTMRGSSAIEGGIDTLYEADGSSALMSLTRRKRKDGPQHDSISLRLKLIEGTGSGVAVDNAGLPSKGPAGSDQVIAIVASSLVPMTTAEVASILHGKIKTSRVSNLERENARRRLVAAADAGLLLRMPALEPRGPVRWAMPDVHADPPIQDQ